MFTMFCDETNLESSENIRFFVYGGLIVPVDAMGELSESIAAIRESHGFEAGDSLKFRTQTRPRSVESDDWNAAKSDVIEAATVADARFIACLVLHSIARNKPKETLIDWQLNLVLDTFSNSYLSERDAHGTVILDRLGNQREYRVMKAKFTEGGQTQTGRYRRFDRIIAYSSTCDGASHLASAADIVLGTFAHCVNQRGDITIPSRLFPKVLPLIYSRGVRDLVWGNGIVLSPADVRVASYQREYADLKTHLRRLARSQG